jgi:hypothetical protein
MAKYRKKPIVIEAVQWNGTWNDEMAEFAKGKFSFEEYGVLYVKTLEGTMVANKGDWIIKGIKGEFYPCAKEIFEQIYEPVEY